MYIYIYTYLWIPRFQDSQSFPEFPRAAPELPELSQCSQSSGRALPRLPQALESTPLRIDHFRAMCKVRNALF